MRMSETDRGTLESLELELQAIVSCLMRVLKLEPRSSARTLCALNHGAISVAQVPLSKMFSHLQIPRAC